MNRPDNQPLHQPGIDSTAAIDEAVELWRSRNARLVSLMHIGSDGWLKTLDFAPCDETHLRSILARGERADGSSLFAGSGISANASDVLLQPRVERAFIDPFSLVPTLVVLASHLDRSGQPLSPSPDTIVRRAAQHVTQATGCELRALGEVEFFLGKPATEQDMYGEDERGYHAASPFVFGEDLRRQALAILADMGLAVKYGHSEVGFIKSHHSGGMVWEQHEIELDLLPIADAADAIVLTQWVLRNLAHRQGMQCSTSPVLAEGHAGNGLHFHLSPWQDGTATPIGSTVENLAPPAKWLIAGLVDTAGALMAFGNRVNESFVRLRMGRESPRTVTWGASDRSALVRLPIVPQTTDGLPAVTPTIEYRLADGSAHPHLTLAGIAQAMVYGRSLDAIDDRLLQTGSNHGSDSAHATALPWTPHEIADALDAQRWIFEAGNVFPGALLDAVVTTLREEAEPAE